MNQQIDIVSLSSSYLVLRMRFSSPHIIRVPGHAPSTPFIQFIPQILTGFEAKDNL